MNATPPTPHDSAAAAFADSYKLASNFPKGTVVYENTDENDLQVLVYRSHFCFCAYVGVPVSHALHGFEDFDIDCHWGLSYTSDIKPGLNARDGRYWFGWDYGHAGDVIYGDSGMPLQEEIMLNAPPQLRALHEHMRERSKALGESPNKAWTLGEVVQEANRVRSSINAQTQLVQQATVTALMGAKNAARLMPSKAAPLFTAKIKKMSRRKQKRAIAKRILVLGLA